MHRPLSTFNGDRIDATDFVPVVAITNGASTVEESPLSETLFDMAAASGDRSDDRVNSTGCSERFS